MANFQQHVNYISNDRKVSELQYSDAWGWQDNILSDLASADDPNSLPYAPIADLDRYATEWNGQQHVNYPGLDNKIHELWYSDDGGWQHNILSDLADADDYPYLPDLARPLDGYATLWNRQQHVNYIGQDGRVHELWYSDGRGWQHNIVSDLAGANDPNSLPVGGTLKFGVPLTDTPRRGTASST